MLIAIYLNSNKTTDSEKGKNPTHLSNSVYIWKLDATSVVHVSHSLLRKLIIISSII